MVLTLSFMIALGATAPDFTLPDVVTGKKVSLKDFAGKKAVLVMFICRHCPYVQHVKAELARLGRDYGEKSVGIIAISSNDAESYPDDAPASLKEMASREGFTFPLLYDRTQEAAQAYKALCTPDFFLFARKGEVTSPLQLVYRGQLDDSRPGNDKPVTGKDLRGAIDAVLSGKPVAALQRPSSGCNIKWKKGNEPKF